jgi:hypothetical protein
MNDDKLKEKIGGLIDRGVFPAGSTTEQIVDAMVKLEAELKAEREVVDFYANPDNYLEEPRRNNLYTIICQDADYIDKDGTERFGGKRAREQQDKRSK